MGHIRPTTVDAWTPRIKCKVAFGFGPGVLPRPGFQHGDNMSEMYVGIDVSKADFHVAMKLACNECFVSQGRYDHTKQGYAAFQAAIDKHIAAGHRIICGMESTGQYHEPLADFLRANGIATRVFNVLELKGYKTSVRKTKTDRKDACAIARALEVMGVEKGDEVQPTLYREIKGLSRLRLGLIHKQTDVKNGVVKVMDSLCRGYSTAFEDILCKSSLEILNWYSQSGQAPKPTLHKITKMLSPYMGDTRAAKKAEVVVRVLGESVGRTSEIDITRLELVLLLQQFVLLDRQKEQVERALKSSFANTGSHITSIPGVGDITGAIVLGELGDVKRFTGAEQITAFAGIEPSTFQSGIKRKEGSISKRGSRVLREALYNAALSASRCNPVCKRFNDRLKDKGKPHRLRMVAVARKLLHIIYSVEKNARPFFDPETLIEQTERAI